MPVSLDFGGVPVKIGELQAGLEDYSASQSTEFAVEHDEQGRHSKPFTETFNVTGRAQLDGGSLLGSLLAFSDEYANEVSINQHDLRNADGSPIPEVNIRLQATVPIQLTGIKPYDVTRRQIHIIENGGSQEILLMHNDVQSTYRFALPGELTLNLESGGIVLVQWDIHSNVWRCLQAGNTMATVQRGTITFSNGGANQVDGTLSSAVEFATAEVRLLGAASDAVGFNCLIRLLDDSHVRAERNNAFNGVGAVVSYEVSGRTL